MTIRSGAQAVFSLCRRGGVSLLIPLELLERYTNGRCHLSLAYAEHQAPHPQTIGKMQSHGSGSSRALDGPVLR